MPPKKPRFTHPPSQIGLRRSPPPIRLDHSKALTDAIAEGLVQLKVTPA